MEIYMNKLMKCNKFEQKNWWGDYIPRVSYKLRKQITKKKSNALLFKHLIERTQAQASPGNVSKLARQNNGRRLRSCT